MRAPKMQLASQTEEPDQKISPSTYSALIDSLFTDPGPMFAGALCAAVAAIMTALKTGNALLWPCVALLVVTGAVRALDTRQYQSTHVTGGTAMGADPATSVVSPHLQHWDAHNLFVVGASVYPHNSGYNPTGILGALALRLGDDLVRYMERPRLL